MDDTAESAPNVHIFRARDRKTGSDSGEKTGGGYIVVGVEEKDGSPVFPIKGIAQNRIDNIEKKLREICNYLEPFYQPVAEPFIYENKHILVIWVSGGFSRPYQASVSLSEKRSEKKYYIRKASSTVVATPEELKQLYYVSSDIPFDDRPNLAAEIEDQLMLGDDLMITPVTEANAKGRSVYLPEDMILFTCKKGKGLDSGLPERKELSKGLHYIEMQADTIAFFMKKGHRIAIAETAMNTVELNMKHLTLWQ